MGEEKDSTPVESNVVLSTVIIQTSQMQELASFYGKGLALGKAQTTGTDHLGFTLSNLYFGFDQVDGANRPAETLSIWFEVDEIKVVFDRFVSLGAMVKYAPSKKTWGGYLAALYDPDGNLFGLSQAGNASAAEGEQ